MASKTHDDTGLRAKTGRHTQRPLRARGGTSRADDSSRNDKSGNFNQQADDNATLANTYKMSPDEDNRFVSYQVEYLMKDLLEAKLSNITYDPTICSKLAQDLCSMIKAKVKELNFVRYRLVSQVVVGQDSDQSVQIASRCLWNHSTDNFAASTYRNNSLFAIAIVYALFLD